MFCKQNKNISLFNIHINNVNIESVQNFNFLGLHLSSDMTWNFDINEVSKKIPRNIAIVTLSDPGYFRQLTTVFEIVGRGGF